MTALEELRALSKIIQDSISDIDAAVAASNLEFPSPYTPFTAESEAARTLPEVERASSLLIAAATQLVQTVRSPTYGILTLAMQVHTSHR
jgi:hypothetical protein